MSELIIIGGSGFIGTNFVKSALLQEKIDKIHLIDLDPPKIKHKKIIFHQFDIINPINIKINVSNGICYHLAALAKEPGYPWENYFESNYTGTINVINFCKNNGIHKIIYTSTMMVYKAGEKKMTEESLTAPDTGYGISKLLGELALKSWANEHKQNYLRIARIAVVYGKGEKGNFTRLYHALKKRRFVYIGKNSTVKSNIYIKDVISFFNFLLTSKSKAVIYNLSYPYEYSINEICSSVFEVFGFKRKIFTIPYLIAIIASYCVELLSFLGIKTSISHRHIQKLYFSTNIISTLAITHGFKFKYNLTSGLSDWKKECLPNEIH